MYFYKHACAHTHTHTHTHMHAHTHTHAHTWLDGRKDGSATWVDGRISICEIILVIFLFRA